MRLILVALAAWFAGIVAHLLPPYLLWQEHFGVEDLLGITLMSSVYSVGVFLLIYLPGLLWLRKRLGGCKPAIYFPLAAATLLNIPVALFVVQFIVAGLLFGVGFVRVYKERPCQQAATEVA